MVLSAPGKGNIHSDSCWGMISHGGFSLYLAQIGQQKTLLTDCERRENYGSSEKILPLLAVDKFAGSNETCIQEASHA